VRRAVSRHDGWAPFNTFGYEAASRTAGIANLDELGDAIAWARQYAKSVGRTEPLDICFSAATLIDGRSVDEQNAVLTRLAELGVTWVIVSAAGGTRDEVISGLDEFADHFVSPDGVQRQASMKPSFS
jgi:hypothetical protein